MSRSLERKPVKGELSGSDDDIDIIGRDDVNNYNEANVLPVSPESMEKIHHWLKPTPYDFDSGEFHKHRVSHLQGTGQWLVQTENYQRWRNSNDQGLLWIKGIPGSGKSVFAAMLADQLAREGSVVLYFFFRQIIDANHQPANLLQDWLDQIVKHSPPLQLVLRDYIETNSSTSVEQLSMKTLWEYLKISLNHMPRVYLVADALDEMDSGNDEFLQSLARLGSWKPGQVKVLLTSRPVATVEKPLHNIVIPQIRLEERLVDLDIATYVDHGLESSSLTVTQRQLTKETVVSRANGLFLYARLVMEAILEPAAKVDQVLAALPADLNSMYSGLLREHARRSGVPNDIQQLILSWVTHATRPLRLLEISEMIKVTYEGAVGMDLKAVKELVRTACGPLLEILPDETVSVVHHSLTEFLLGKTRSAGFADNDGQTYPVLLPGPTHERLALSCLCYLSAGCLDSIKVPISADGIWSSSRSHDNAPGKENRNKDARLQFPFLDYAAKNWPTHVKKSAETGLRSSSLPPAMDMLLEPGQKFDAWLEMIWPQFFWFPDRINDINMLHVIGRFDLYQYLETLLSRGEVDVDCVGRHGKTSLSLAAWHGHHDTVRTLIEAGADPHRINNGTQSALQSAAQGNHAEVIKVLLKAGVDPFPATMKEKMDDIDSRDEYKPLMTVCKQGHLAALEAFTPFFRDLDTAYKALICSAKNGHSKLVKHLIQYPGIDVNAKTRGLTPIFNAARRQDNESIEALLQAGADATLVCTEESDGSVYFRFDTKSYAANYFETSGAGQSGATCTEGNMTPLQAFCGHWQGSRLPDKAHALVLRRGFELLMQVGSDVNHRNAEGLTALHHAGDCPVLVRLLLRAGADASAETLDGNTPLHVPQRTIEDGLEVVKLLIEEGGADINTTNAEGLTPLLIHLQAARDSLEFPLRFVEKFGPDCNIPDKYGNTPLHQVVQKLRCHNKRDLIKQLVANGADVNRRNKAGQTPTQCTNNIEVIECLLEAGADIESRGLQGETILHKWLLREGVAERLVMLGANVRKCDCQGRSLLFKAMRGFKYSDSWSPDRDPFKLIDWLISQGLDPRALDSEGNTLIHELCSLRSEQRLVSQEIDGLKTLMELGIRIDAGNNRGRTSLHELCSRSLEDEPYLCEILDFVLEQYEHVETVSDHGIRPVHLAAGVSELAVRKLIAVGANLTAATYQGARPLHLAAIARQSNIVGLLLDTIMTGSFGDARGIIAAKDNDNRSALYYACRSGRPETVALLLDTGAAEKDCVEDLVDALYDFEVEAKRWNKDRLPAEEGSDGRCGLSGRPGAESRPTYVCIDKRREKPDRAISANLQHASARLEEIVQLLWKYGVDFTQINQGSRDHFLGDECNDYYRSVLQRLQDQIMAKDQTTVKPLVTTEDTIHLQLLRLRVNAKAESLAKGTKLKDFRRTWSDLRQTAIATAFHSTSAAERMNKDQSIQAEMLNLLIYQRQYVLLAEIFRKDLIPTMHTFGKLVMLGLDELLAGLRLGTDLVKKMENHDWCIEQEKWTKGNHNSNISRGSIVPLVLRACQRELPNMPVLQVLVERLGASVDAPHWQFDFPGGRGEGSICYHVDDSPLHHVVRGLHWWHAKLALPYLISRGADLDIRDFAGNTPLHMALKTLAKNMKVVRRSVVKQLVVAGADVNATNFVGLSCLAAAADDIELTKMLIESGATVTPYAIFSAIIEEDDQLLRLLLAGGIDPNGRCEPLKKNKETSQSGSSNILPQRDITFPLGAEEHEDYPLRYAASGIRHDRSKAPLSDEYRKIIAGLVQILLDHGADPFATFLEKIYEEFLPRHSRYEVGEEEQDESAVGIDNLEESLNKKRPCKEHTVLHCICRTGGLLDPFLKIPGMDLERRDSEGRTILLAASESHYFLITSVLEESGEKVPLVTALLERGVDVSARDDSGKNVLHNIARKTMPWFEEERTTITGTALKTLLDADPALVNGSNNKGQTPLHIALHRMHYVFEYRGRAKLNTRMVDLLLEAGSDPHAKDGLGNSVLHVIAKYLDRSKEYHQLWARFLATGLDINARNAKGETPIFLYFGYFKGEIMNQEATVEFLDSCGVDWAAKDARGRSVLHCTARNGDVVEQFKRLVAKGLNPRDEDRNCQTSLDVAAACGNTKVLSLFERDNARNEASYVP